MLKASNRTIAEFQRGSVGDDEHIFVHGADPQLGLIDEADGGDGTKWPEELRLLKKAVSAVNNMTPRPKFLFLNGDLVNALPGTGSHKLAQENDLIEVINTSEVPVLVSSGNHDIGNTPTDETVDHYTSLFGDDYYSFNIGNTFYVVLNSQYFYNTTVMKSRAADQMNWLERQLNSAKSAKYDRTIVFMHIPPFTTSPDEEDGIFNHPRAQRKALLEKFANSGVQYVFAGHYHRNSGGFWQNPATPGDSGDASNKVEVVVSSAIGKQIGDDKSGLRVVSVTKGEVSHEYFAFEEFP